MRSKRRNSSAPALDLVRIPAGSFVMGSSRGQENERPLHEVWVDEVHLARTPVTNREYGRFLDAFPERTPKSWGHPRYSHPDQPVVAITWFDAVAYCKWLTDVTGVPYRLPTEAEREKAARAGRDSAYPWGEDVPRWATMQGYCSDRPERVASSPPNDFGLYNMGDLVHEWCADWYDHDYYCVSPAQNPTGPDTGVRRASRGGSWRHAIKVTRCAARSSLPPDRMFTDYGFRVAA